MYKNAVSDGDGWGATGNNSCQKVEFNKCKLSRIDFHKPFRERLRIIDCDVGDEGIQLTGLGDVIIQGGSLRSREAVSGSHSFVASRVDTGGFIDGDLVLNSVRLLPRQDETLIALHESNAGYTKPTGSPINYQWFQSVTVDTVLNNSEHTIEIAPLVSTDAARSGVAYPTKVSIDNCEGLFQFTRLLSNQLCGNPVSISTTPYENRFNLYISVKDTNLESTQLRGSAPDYNVKFAFYNADLKDARFDVGGVYQITDSKVWNLDVSLAVKPAIVTVLGGAHISAATDSIKQSPTAEVFLDDVTVYFTGSATVNSVLEARMNNVFFPTVGSSINISSDNPNGPVGSYTLISNVRRYTSCQLTYTVAGAVNRLLFEMPPVGYSVGGIANNGETIVLHRTTDTNVTVQCGANVKANIMGVVNK